MRKRQTIRKSPLPACGEREPRGARIHRRSFLTLLAGAAAASAWALPLRARQSAPLIGFLHPTSRADIADLMAAFHKGLGDSGYAEGKNFNTEYVEYRWAEGHNISKLPELAADLVNRRVALIVAGGGSAAARAVKAATESIPVVFIGGDDPVKRGLAVGLSRPGGNVTGVVFSSSELAAKRVELLKQLMPAAKMIAYLVNTDNPESVSESASIREAARALGIEMQYLICRAEHEIDKAFERLSLRRADAMLVGSDPMLLARREQVTALVARHKIPAIYPLREFAAAGGLVSYGSSVTNAYREAGLYAARILKGEKPADLPVLQPAKFALTINLKTAKTLGLEIPAALLKTADEVIE